MKAMILAAGRGERMRPLTDSCPKPLLEAAGKPLIVWHLERLAAAGFNEVVINHAHLGAMLEQRLGDGRLWNLHITYSPEPPGALETAGGIAYALPLLGNENFLVVNGDIWCDWSFVGVAALAQSLAANGDLAWLLLVPNPPQHPLGDFALKEDRVVSEGMDLHTFSGIGIYNPSLFASVVRGHSAKLAPLLRAAIAGNRVGGALHSGRWTDVGTVQRLAQLDAELR